MTASRFALVLAAMGCLSGATPCPGGETPTVVVAAIAAGTDDAEEAVAGASAIDLSAGDLYTTSSDIELGYDKDKYDGNQYVGLRFAQVGVPPNSYVHTAHVAFTVDKVGSCCNESFSVTVKLHKSANSPAFGSGGAYLRGLWTSGSTAASLTYSPEEHDTVGASVTTPDLASLVQEVVDQPSWAANNAITVLFGDSTGTTEAHSREYESYDTDPTQAPKLEVSYCPMPRCPDGSYATAATARVTSSADDAEEAAPGATGGSVAVGALYTGSSDMELGYDDDKYTGNQYTGLRFTGVAVPKGANVVHAAVKFWVDAAGACCNGELNITAKMAKVANQPPFAGQAALHSLFTTGSTGAQVTYTPAVDAAGDVHKPRYSADFSGLVNEVAGQSGWASGNAMAVVFGGATGAGEPNSREYESFDTDPHMAPGIMIAYCGGGPGAVGTTSGAHGAATGALMLCLPLLAFFSLMGLAAEEG